MKSLTLVFFITIRKYNKMNKLEASFVIKNYSISYETRSSELIIENFAQVNSAIFSKTDCTLYLGSCCDA